MKKIYLLAAIMSATLMAKPITTFKGEAQVAMQEAKSMLGRVPVFFTYFPEAAIPGAWQEFKEVELSSNTAIPGKYKDLIGVAVAAQIPCHYCSYFHGKAVTALYKGTDNEVYEAIAIAANARHWSAFFSGMDMDQAAFRRDVDKMFKTEKAIGMTNEEATKTLASTPETEKTMDSYQKTLADIQKTFGFVPDFMKKYPATGLPGAWAELKMLHMNPNTEIPAKYKALISLAVSSQIPSPSSIYLDTRAARNEGATDQEISEAVTLAGLTRHWSTVLNGNLISEKQFMKDTDFMMAYVKKNMQKNLNKDIGTETVGSDEQTR